MLASSVKSAYLKGLIAGLPFVIMIVPFALLFGVVAFEAGLQLSQIMGFSALVVAGASQFTALQFMAENAPFAVIILSALAVNLRMAMYSAAITPHLGHAPLWQRAIIAYCLVDQTYAMAAETYEKHADAPASHKVAYFFGVATPLIPLWLLFTWVGAVLGGQIPPQYGLDFAMPLAFLAMVAPALRTIAHIAAAAVSVILALVLGFVPLNLGLLIAAITAMIVGAEIERRMS